MAITASLTPSQTSGPAPLAVFFDATGTACDEVSEGRFGGVFHQVLADFDYGDDPDASWPYWADVYTTETSGMIYAVVTTSSTAPSAAQIAAGTDENDVSALDAWSFSPTVAEHYEHAVFGMVAGTIYYLYYVHDAGSATYGSVTTGLSHLARSKNYDTAVAPLGYHVFETPGTYTVTMTVRAGEGLADTTTVEITVTNPDTVYSGTNTICVSAVADYTDAPAGATTQTTVPAAADLPNKRILFRRGESFTLPKFDNGTQNTQFGVFGPEGDGYVDLTYTPCTLAQGNGNGNWSKNVTFLEGIRFASFGEDYGVRHYLLYRVKLGSPAQNTSALVGFGNLAEFSARTASTDELAGYITLPRNIFIHECHVAPDPGYMATTIISYLLWTDSAYAGCYSNRNNTQTWRTLLASKCIYQDNRAPGDMNGNPRNIFKTQAMGPKPFSYIPVKDSDDAYGEGADPWRGRYATQYVVYRFNDMCGEMLTQAQPIALSQQNSQANGVWSNSEPQLVENCIVEKNHFRYDPQLRTVCSGWGKNLTMRNNTSDPSNFYGEDVSWRDAATYKRDTSSYIRNGKNVQYNVDNLVEAFQVGEIVTGQTTGSTAEVSATSNGGLTVNFIKGSGNRGTNGLGRSTSLGLFADDEIVIGSLGGEATINAPDVPIHYYVVAEYVDDDMMEPYHEYDLEDDDATPPGVPRSGFLSSF